MEYACKIDYKIQKDSVLRCTIRQEMEGKTKESLPRRVLVWRRMRSSFDAADSGVVLGCRMDRHDKARAVQEAGMGTSDADTGKHEWEQKVTFFKCAFVS